MFCIRFYFTLFSFLFCSVCRSPYTKCNERKNEEKNHWKQTKFEAELPRRGYYMKITIDFSVFSWFVVCLFPFFFAIIMCYCYVYIRVCELWMVTVCTKQFKNKNCFFSSFYFRSLHCNLSTSEKFLRCKDNMCTV